MAACGGGNESLVRLIVSKGCRVNAGDRVFYYFDLLFSSGNRVSLQDGRTALYYAATKGYGIIAEYLIKECGANVNDVNQVNRRLLYGNSHDIITISY